MSALRADGDAPVTQGELTFSRRQIGQETGKHVVFMRLDDVCDPQRMDVDAVAHGEGARGFPFPSVVGEMAET